MVLRYKWEQFTEVIAIVVVTLLAWLTALSIVAERRRSRMPSSTWGVVAVPQAPVASAVQVGGLEA